MPAAIANLLLRLEWMVTFGCQQQKPLLVTDVLHIGQTLCFSSGSLSLGQVDAILGNEFAIEGFRVFALGQSARDVPPVPMPQITDGNLLNESFGAAGNASVVHTEKSITHRSGSQEVS